MRKILILTLLLASGLLCACRNHDRDLIAAAADEINAPATQSQLLGVPGIMGVSSTFAGDSLSIDVRVQVEQTGLNTLDPGTLALLMVEQMRDNDDGRLIEALRDEEVAVIVHVNDASGRRLTRVAVTPDML